MKKQVFNIVSAALLICFVASNSSAEVRKVIDEKDILKITKEYSATPAGLAVSSQCKFIFFENSTAAVMEYDPADKKFTVIADANYIKSLIHTRRGKRNDSKIKCFDLEVDSEGTVYALINTRTNNKTYVVQISDGKHNGQKVLAKISDKALVKAELEIDQARKQLIILMDTYKGADDPNFNGIYTLGIEDNSEGLKNLKSFAQIGRAVTEPLIAGDKPIGGTGLAVEGDYVYWHLTVGPANAHLADGDLVMINLVTGKAEVALDRKQLISDIGPEGLGQDGNFYFTTFDIDGHDLFMMVNVGVGDRAQNVHQYYVDGNEFEYKGVAAYAEEILEAGNQLGVPLIFYSTECQAKDGKFYIFSGSNLVENLLEITPDYSDPSLVRVAVFSGKGGDGASAFNALVKHPDLYVQKVSPKQIQDGILKDFDVILQPGGSGRGQAGSLEAKGCKAIKDFVRAGNGYVGICGGAYLACSGYDYSLHIINAISIERTHWARGGGGVDVELTPQGRRIISDIPGTVRIRYGQGPLFAPGNDHDLPPYTVLAYFREGITELNNTKATLNGAVEGAMEGIPAITAAQYGDGRVAIVSPHPETKDSGLQFFIHHLARWAAKAKPCNRADMIDKPQQDGIKYVQRNYGKTPKAVDSTCDNGCK